MKIGVLSDTHGELACARLAADVFRAAEVGCVLHCGDIGADAVVDALAGLPVHYVFGNCDFDHEGLRCRIESRQQHCHGMFGSVAIEGINIFFLHGHQAERFETEIVSGRWQLICSGHTHQSNLHFRQGTLLLNPGALHRVARPSVALVDLPTLEAEIVIL